MRAHKLRAPYFQIRDGNLTLLKTSEIVIWERASPKIVGAGARLGISEMSLLSGWEEQRGVRQQDTQWNKSL